MIIERWWSGRELVNGVFKGGGAKGIAYAGALMALEESDVEQTRWWFGAAAGASAGAITATLIAAGLTPSQIVAETGVGLPSIGKLRPWSAVALATGLRDTALANTGLRAWLGGVLARQFGVDDGDRLTFADIASSGIELFVVALDLVSGLPVVFNHRTSPDCSVVEAVLASCAIPGAFPPGRMALDTASGYTVRRLVDGGAWANYPDFVFRDPSFAAWVDEVGSAHVSMTTIQSRPTIGFVLGRFRVSSLKPAALIPPSAHVPASYDAGTLKASGRLHWFILSRIIGTRAMRLAIAALVIFATVTALVQLPSTIRSVSQRARSLPPGIYELTLTFFPALLAFALLASTAVFLALLFFGRR